MFGAKIPHQTASLKTLSAILSKKLQKMNIKLTSLLFLTIFYSCKSQKNSENFLTDDLGVIFEK